MTAKLNIFIAKHLVALRGRLMSFVFALAVGACLLAGAIAGPAQAASLGSVTNYTGPGMSNLADIAAGPDGALWFTNLGGESIGRISTSGSVTNYTDPSIRGPLGIAAGPDGVMWFTNTGNDSIGRIEAVGPPSLTITTPPTGAVYAAGQVVDASYSCTDATGGPGIASCTGTVATGSPIDTTTPPGMHTFTVTATSRDGQSTTVTRSYNVTKVATKLTASPLVVLLGTNPSLGKASATLTAGAAESPLPGKKVTFSVGSRVACTAITAGDGVASCRFPLTTTLVAVLAGGYHASFAGDGTYLASDATGPAAKLGVLGLSRDTARHRAHHHHRRHRVTHRRSASR